VARRGQKRNVYRMLIWKHEGKRPLGGFSPRLKGNIKMDIKEITWGV
jgi:hypothetical protein